MRYSQPVTEVIKRRSSWRSYLDTPVDKETREWVNKFLDSCTVGPFGTPARFSLVTASEEDGDTLRGLGTYGFIKGARAFIVGAVRHSERNLEDYGYLMERIILFATDLGLGTCWLGGSFNKSNFSRKIRAGAHEVVPAVSPIGYLKDKRSKRDMLIRWSIGAKTRMEWESLFFEEDFGMIFSQEEAGDYEVPLEMVRLGPSASNKQPWRVVKEKDKPVFHFFLQRSKRYDKSEKLFSIVDVQRLDMGIAMCHFELSAEEVGLTGKWSWDTPPALALPERVEYIVTWRRNAAGPA